MLLTTKDVQQRLKISRDMAYRLMHIKGFPRIKLSGRYYIEEDQLQNFLKQYAGRDLVLEK